MLTLWLIRHGKTAGNQQRRYIGRTDEPLCTAGREALHPLADQLPSFIDVWGSPMLRCVQTAEILFPQAAYHPVDDLRECNFGEFENKNYEELSGNPAYQAWLNSMGQLPFPGGEAHEDFVHRCGQGFCRCVEEILALGLEETAILLHGGSIMSILALYEGSDRGFYHWQVANGDGFKVEIDPVHWQKRRQFHRAYPISM